MNLSDSKKKLALAGVLCGLVAACLAYFGNPANMAFCIACFIRDTAGALGFHQAEVVQYARPEIIGLVIGAFIISVATKEYRSTAGSSPMIRFVLGVQSYIQTHPSCQCLYFHRQAVHLLRILYHKPHHKKLSPSSCNLLLRRTVLLPLTSVYSEYGQ